MGQAVRTNRDEFGAASEEDLAWREQVNRDQERIYSEVHPYIRSLALRVTTGRQLSEKHRRTVMSHMRRSLESGATVYRELYTSLTGDKEFAAYAQNETADKGVRGTAQETAREAPGLTAFQRTRLAEKIIDKDTALKIRRGEATSEEINDYIGRRNEEIRELDEEIKTIKEELGKSRGETAEEREEVSRWFRQYQKTEKELKAARKEIGQLGKKLEAARGARKNQAERMRAGREKAEDKLREQLAAKREEISALRQRMKDEVAHARKQGRLEAGWKWAEERQRLAEKEAEREKKEADKKAAQKYLEENKKLAAWIMSADRIGMNVWVRQRELILGIQNALFETSKDAAEAWRLGAEIREIEKKLDKAKKRLARADGEDARADIQRTIDRYEAHLENLVSARQYTEIKDVAQKLEKAKRRLARAEGDKTAMAGIQRQIEEYEAHLENLKSSLQYVEIKPPELSGIKTEQMGEGVDTVDTGTIVYNGKTMSVEEFRKQFYEHKIRYGFMDSKLRKALRKSAPSARSLREQRKYSAANLARGMSQEDLLAVKAVMQQLQLEGRANWERRQFAVHFHQQQLIKAFLNGLDELVEEGKTGEAKRYIKAMENKNTAEREKLLAKGTDAMRLLFYTWDDKRLVQWMDGNKKGPLYRFIIRERLRYANRRDIAVNRRISRVMELVGKDAEKRIRELGEKNITIEGIGPRKAIRKWEWDAGFNLQEAETSLEAPTQVDVSLADLMFMKVALDNKFAREHILYGNLWSADERAMYEQLKEKDGKIPKTVMEHIKGIGLKKETAIRKALDQYLTGDLLKIVDAIQKDFDAHFPETKAVFEDMFNQVVEGQDNYLPIVITEGKYAQAEKQSEIEALAKGSYQVRINPDKGMNLSRVDIGPTYQTEIETDVFKVFFKGVEREEHFAKFAPYIRDLNTVLRGRNNGSKQLAAQLTDIYGK
jgi:hypothetical protein